MKKKIRKKSKLKTSIDQKYIFSLKKLSYHTKCILSKITTDFLFSSEPLDWDYLEDNIFETWAEETVHTALNELADNDIMFVNMCDCDDCNEEECGSDELMFNPEFIDNACPYLNHCSCCNPAPANFNVIYN